MFVASVKILLVEIPCGHRGFRKAPVPAKYKTSYYWETFSRQAQPKSVRSLGLMREGATPQLRTILCSSYAVRVFPACGMLDMSARATIRSSAFTTTVVVHAWKRHTIMLVFGGHLAPPLSRGTLSLYYAVYVVSFCSRHAASVVRDTLIHELPAAFHVFFFFPFLPVLLTYAVCRLWGHVRCRVRLIIIDL